MYKINYGKATGSDKESGWIKTVEEVLDFLIFNQNKYDYYEIVNHKGKYFYFNCDGELVEDIL